jgi:rubrerythrin
LEAVILYEEELSEFSNKDIRIVLQTIINDEKEHTEHLTEILFKYDNDPYGSIN